MPRIQCNLHEVKQIDNLPSGVYSVRCIAVDMTESSQQHTSGLKLTIQFTDPGTEIGPGTPRVWGRGIRNNEVTLWKSKEMGWNHFKVKEACEAFGVPFDETGFDTEHFINAEAKVGVGQESYTPKAGGETRIQNILEHWLKA